MTTYSRSPAMPPAPPTAQHPPPPHTLQLRSSTINFDIVKGLLTITQKTERFICKALGGIALLTEMCHRGGFKSTGYSQLVLSACYCGSRCKLSAIASVRMRDYSPEWQGSKAAVSWRSRSSSKAENSQVLIPELPTELVGNSWSSQQLLLLV